MEQGPMPMFALNALMALIALEHLLFLVLEMFLWTKPIGLKVFHLSAEVAELSATLAANQGLYNGFLAAGLVWAIAGKSLGVALFFLSCVAVAGVFGAVTVGRNIFFVQALPALVALLLLWWAS